MKQISSILLSCLLLLPAGMNAEEDAPKQWTLRDCIDYALENNITIQRNRISAESAQEDVKTAKADFLPSLSGNISQRVVNRPNSARGTIISGDNITTSESKTSYNGSYGIDANWTVYNGSKRVNTVKQQKLNNRIAELNVDESENSIEESITQLYVQILYSAEAVKVNESTVDSTHNVVITQRPQIVGDKFDITQPLYYETNSGKEAAIWVNAATKLKNVKLSCEKFPSLGLSADSIDFLSAPEGIITEFQVKGIGAKHIYQEDKDLSNAKITLSENFVKSLPDGEYIFTIKAVDTNEKENTQVLTIVVSDAIVVTEAPARSGIWAKKATLSGTLVKETSETLSFQYRKSGSQEWISVPAVLSGTSISAEVTQLEPGTTYEYQAVAGTQASVKTITFTTEEATTLPNSSFEDWHTPDKAMVIYPQGGEMFWDSGNHGSATMNKNVTTPDETYKHSGKYSVKLQSQFVGVMGIGKFAAGNLFTGQFIGRDGTNGILDFGRAFTSRPSKLRGYIKYTPGTVDYSETDALTNGATDIGIVYIALGDWDAPVHITTKDKNLFDKNDEKIIAYGEQELTTQTQGQDGGLLEFEIPLDYRSLTRIPSYIVIVASASKYGDYFTGSTGSTMWLDDLELIYE